ncbi:MAG: hypothetical protein GY909_16210 [Oligoflexia bacterium]|nr:hypothetical protein [Oligoflexia bacterium]
MRRYLELRERFNKLKKQSSEYINSLKYEINELLNDKTFIFNSKSLEDLKLDVEVLEDELNALREMKNLVIPKTTNIKAYPICSNEYEKAFEVLFKNLGENEFLKRLEEECILRALQHCEGNKVKTAKFLGISYRGLNNKIKRINEVSDV